MTDEIIIPDGLRVTDSFYVASAALCYMNDFDAAQGRLLSFMASDLTGLTLVSAALRFCSRVTMIEDLSEVVQAGVRPTYFDNSPSQWMLLHKSKPETKVYVYYPELALVYQLYVCEKNYYEKMGNPVACLVAPDDENIFSRYQETEGTLTGAMHIPQMTPLPCVVPGIAHPHMFIIYPTQRMATKYDGDDKPDVVAMFARGIVICEQCFLYQEFIAGHLTDPNVSDDGTIYTLIIGTPEAVSKAISPVDQPMPEQKIPRLNTNGWLKAFAGILALVEDERERSTHYISELLGNSNIEARKLWI